MSDDEIYQYLGQQFEWNREKARKNWIDHRVLFTEAATVSSIRVRSIMRMKNIPMRKNDMLWSGILQGRVNFLSSMCTVASERD